MTTTELVLDNSLDQRSLWRETCTSLKVSLAAYRKYRIATRLFERQNRLDPIAYPFTDYPKSSEGLCLRCGYGTTGARAHHLLYGFLKGRTWLQMEFNHGDGDDRILPYLKKSVLNHTSGLILPEELLHHVS